MLKLASSLVMTTISTRTSQVAHASMSHMQASFERTLPFFLIRYAALAHTHGQVMHCVKMMSNCSIPSCNGFLELAPQAGVSFALHWLEY